jgi:hypothetical protein
MTRIGSSDGEGSVAAAAGRDETGRSADIPSAAPCDRSVECAPLIEVAAADFSVPLWRGHLLTRAARKQRGKQEQQAPFRAPASDHDRRLHGERESSLSGVH